MTKLYIDSANIEDVKTAISSGIASGITTNPSIVAKEAPHEQGYLGHLRDLIRAIGSDFPFSVQPPLEELRESPRETVGKIVGFLQARNIAIKIPVSSQNLGLIRTVSQIIPVNATCVFSAEQAIAAIQAGARYVSFFWCRMNEADANVVNNKGGHKPGGAAEGSVHLIRSLIDQTRSPCQIICGSIRAPQDAVQAFAAGAHIVTAGLPTLHAMADNPLSAASTDKFLKSQADYDAACAALSASGREGQDPSGEQIGGETPATP